MKTVTQPCEKNIKRCSRTRIPARGGDAIRDDEITPAARKTIEKAYEFLTRHLIPHARRRIGTLPGGAKSDGIAGSDSHNEPGSC